MSQLMAEADYPSLVKQCLRTALPGAQFDAVEMNLGLESILLLRFKHLLVAFAFGSDESAYDDLYSGFKTYFTSMKGEWDALDVSFVYCLTPDAALAEFFYSKVETDVYFCRKFVVPLGTDVSASLARLPFLPLASATGTAARPPTAQTYLQQCNMPADLARYIVTQGARSAQAIAQGCIDGSFGSPEEIFAAPALHTKAQERSSRAISLESITISNFRAYRKAKTFKLGSAVTVLYGPNGFGKTSFFDALDFAVTGGIGRMPGISTSAFEKAAKHLDSGSEDGGVEITFRSGEDHYTVSRSTADPKQALLDSKQVDRKTILAHLTGSENPASDRVDSLVALFRATHLFSQETQELTRNFRDDCQLPVEIVSRMLAFEDYVSAIGKVTDVLKLLQSGVTAAGVGVRDLDGQITEDRGRLSRLEAISKEHAVAGALEADLARLSSDIASLGIAVGGALNDAKTLRTARTHLEARVSELESTSGKLASAVVDTQRLRSHREEIIGLSDSTARLEDVIAQLQLRRADEEERLRELDGKVAAIQARDSQVQQRLESTEWALASKATFEKLRSDQKACTAAINALTAAGRLIRNERGLKEESSRLAKAELES